MRGILTSLFVAVFALSSLGQTYQVVILSPVNGFNETRGSGLYNFQRVGSARLTGAPQPEDSHAVLWLGDSITPIDLNPTTYFYSQGFDTDGTRQVGRAYLPSVPNPIGNVAALWSGTASSFVPLCAFPYCGNSTAYAIWGDQQVGFTDDSHTCSECGPTYILHAALWRGTPASHVDLHPLGIGCDRSFAFDTDGAQQVGYGTFPASNHSYRALLWRGTAASVVDLSPPSYEVTFANAVRSGVQVGYGQNYVDGGYTLPDALVWHGTAASVASLGQGVLEDTNGTRHVGAKGFGYYNHAFRWDGETGAGFDLHSLLPAGVYVNSGAEQIDAAGNIIGWAQRADSYFLEAILWRVSSATPNSMPSITLMSPFPYSRHQVNTFIELSAQAVDGDGSIASVEFLADGQIIGSGTVVESAEDATAGSSFQMLWKPVRGGYVRIQARATDNVGAVSYSRPSLIYVSSTVGG
jgi:hypothetical protein